MRLAKNLFASLCLSIAVAACGDGDSEMLLQAEAALCSDGTLGAAIRSTGPVPSGCVRIEGTQIGRAPQTLNVGGVSVTIDGWTEKTGSAGEFVGFSFTQAGGSVAYAVKASTRTFASKGTSWLHPNGTSGPSANGISNITFCKDGSGGGGTDGGGSTTTPPNGGTDGGPFDDGSGGGSNPAVDGGIFDDGSGGGGSSPRDGGTPGSGEECPPNGGGSGGSGPVPGSSGTPCGSSSSCAAGLVCEQGLCIHVIE